MRLHSTTPPKPPVQLKKLSIVTKFTCAVLIYMLLAPVFLLRPVLSSVRGVKRAE